MEKIVCTWETNEDLSLKQREAFKFLEESYLREKHSRKEKVCKFSLKDNSNKFYIMIDSFLYGVDSEEEDCYCVSRGEESKKCLKDQVIKTEGSRVWKLSF